MLKGLQGEVFSAVKMFAVFDSEHYVPAMGLFGHLSLHPPGEGVRAVSSPIFTCCFPFSSLISL
jgi:hypothetical protein